ncbi:MAG: OmpA family protein [Cyclobacteriaceae bacterium]
MENFTANAQVFKHSVVKRIILKATLTVAFFLSAFFVFSQYTPSENKKANNLYSKAEQFIVARDFSSGISYYKKAIQRDRDFAQAYKRLGMSFEVLGERDSSFYYYDKYLKIQGIHNMPQHTAFFLIELYLKKGRYKKAAMLLHEYPVIDSEDKKYQDLLKRINFAVDGSKNPMNHRFELLSDSVNKHHSQYFPIVTVDNSQLIFTQRSGGSTEDDEDLMISYATNGGWSSASSISPLINSADNEGASTISADGRTLIFTSCEEKNSFGSCDLFISFKIGNSWTKPRNLGPTVNSIYWDSQPSLSADGRILYFSSNRPGGKGGRDLWFARYENDQWTKPQNAGSEINTKEDEVTPYLHFNNQTLFFSSSGHLGFGGYDLFKIELLDSSQTEPVNLGYGINNELDQISMTISADGSFGYFAQEFVDRGGYRRSKLSKVTFDESGIIKNEAVYVIGRVIDAKSLQPVKAEIMLSNLKSSSEKEAYKTRSDGLSGDFYFVLTQGSTYGVFVKARNYLFEDFTFDVVSNDVSRPDSLFIYLQPLEENAELTLENIYFEFDSYELSPESRSELLAIARFLEENNVKVEISGHTDSKGDESYNAALSKRRAEAVFDYLVDLGVSAEKMISRGYGAELPLIKDQPASPANRRIDFKILTIN